MTDEPKGKLINPIRPIEPGEYLFACRTADCPGVGAQFSITVPDEPWVYVEIQIPKHQACGAEPALISINGRTLR